MADKHASFAHAVHSRSTCALLDHDSETGRDVKVRRDYAAPAARLPPRNSAWIRASSTRVPASRRTRSDR